MSSPGARPLFVDTGAFYARADADDDHHGEATDTFAAIRSGDAPFRPLFTSHAVVSELATLALYKLGHEDAVGLLTAVRSSGSINVLPVGRASFAVAADQFATYDDQAISFVDHSSSVLAREHDVEHVFGFDDDFRTLGFTLVPEDTNLPGT